MVIREARTAVVGEIEEKLSVIAAGYPIAELGLELEAAVASFQALGICNLLLRADREGLFRNLILSGYGRRYYLRKCKEQGVSNDPSLAISRTESFLDLIAAGDLGTAREIAAASPFDWIRDGEYEEDYCYRAFLHELIGSEPESAAACEALLSRWEQVLEGGASPRLELCGALLHADAAVFGERFEALLAERDAETAAQESLDDPLWPPRRHLFVEGLALLELARLRGVQVEGEHELCPSLARHPQAPPAPDDLFRELELQFGL